MIICKFFKTREAAENANTEGKGIIIGPEAMDADNKYHNDYMLSAHMFEIDLKEYPYCVYYNTKYIVDKKNKI